jgi:hypothetical protein
MKALTIRQPWASLIMAGIKDVENRTWTTGYRGRLAIHAGARVEADGLAAHGHLLPRGDLPRGAMLGTVSLVDVVENHPSVWAVPGLWHWVLADPNLLSQPIPMSGRLGLWTWESSKRHGSSRRTGR